MCTLSYLIDVWLVLDLHHCISLNVPLYIGDHHHLVLPLILGLGNDSLQLLSAPPPWNNMSHVLCFSSKSFRRIHTINEYPFSLMIEAITRFFLVCERGEIFHLGQVGWLDLSPIYLKEMWFTSHRVGTEDMIFYRLFYTKSWLLRARRFGSSTLLKGRDHRPCLGVGQTIAPW